MSISTSEVRSEMNNPKRIIPMLYFIWSNPNKIFTVVNAVAINVMVQCSETELNHYINANGISKRNYIFEYDFRLR